MHLISFDASPKQLSKLRNGHRVRIKKGKGFNLVVNPGNYNLVSRAFTKNKGVDIQLSEDELNLNSSISPEEHDALQPESNLFEHLPFMEGGNIFKKMKKALYSKKAKKLGRELQPISRAMKQSLREELHDELANQHMMMADEYGDDPRMARIINAGAQVGHKKIGGNGLYASAGGNGIYAGAGGNGLYASAGGRGFNGYNSLALANAATARANDELAKMHNASIHGMRHSPVIYGHWDNYDAPPSRGFGLATHHNMIRGRGSLLYEDNFLPPALQSQPYGANYHMQFQLPPQYKKYNSGTDIEGRGLFA
jgi:hypothetical protein